MGSVLLASFPGASSTTGGSCWRSKKCTKNYYASSYGKTTLWHKTWKIQKEYCVKTSPRHNLKHHYKGIGGGSTRQECERKYFVNATSGQSFEYEPQAQDPKSIWDSVKHALDAFYRFSRPYSILATALSITSLSLLAVEKLSDLSPAFFIASFQAMVAAISMNIFNCGLNQLFDVEIDKINKPYLPLASGEYSFRTGVIITVSSLILVPYIELSYLATWIHIISPAYLLLDFPPAINCFWLAWSVGSWPLFWALFIGAVLAAAYSIDLPLLRWKKSPVLAAMCILTNRAIAIPLGYFLHIQTYVFKRPATFPRPLIFCTAILSLIFAVLSLFKDIPDIEGDKKFGVRSLSVHLGQKWVFWICVSLLEMAYGVTILVGATSPFLWSKILTGLGHVILASVLWYHAKSIDLKSKVALQSFYLFIWKLLYAEYFLIPLFR